MHPPANSIVTKTGTVAKGIDVGDEAIRCVVHRTGGEAERIDRGDAVAGDVVAGGGELAERINIARQSLNAIENGKADPSLPLGMRIAKVFGVRVEDVFSEQ